MSRFRVGSLVRIVSTGNPQLACFVGREGRITAPSRTYSGQWHIDTALLLDGGRIAWDSDHLEPILPEGAAPSTWDQCAWQPEHMRAPA